MSENLRPTHESTPLLQVPQADPDHHHHHHHSTTADDASSIFSYATFHTVQEPDWDHQPNLSTDIPSAETEYIDKANPLSHEPMIVVPRSSCCSSSSSSTDTAAVDSTHSRRRRLLIVCLCISTASLLIDTGFVMILLNQIATDFESGHLAAWIQISYLVASATVQPLSTCFANLGDHRAMLVVSHTLFLIGTVLCGFAHNMTQMLVARAVAGLGGGCILSLASTAVHDTAKERGRLQTHMMAIQMVGALIGAPLGGLVQDRVGWRYCFYGNAVPCALLVPIYLFMSPTDCSRQQQITVPPKKQLGSTSALPRPPLTRTMDWAGILLFGAANVVLVVGLGNANEPRPRLVGGCLGAGFALWVIFFVYENKVPSNPIVPWRSMAQPKVAAACIVNFCIAAVEMAGMYLMPQFFLDVTHASATMTGAWNVPRLAAAILMSWIAGRFLIKHCYPTIVLSMAICIGAVVAVASWTAETSPTLIGLSQAAYGAVSGAVCITSMAILLVDMPKPEMASTLPLLHVIRAIGRLYSMVGSATLFQANIKNLLASEVEGSRALEAVGWARIAWPNYMTLELAVEKVINTSIRQTYLYLVLPFAVVGFLASFWTRRGMQ
ncbi:major facilitator superfamily domain-containing protein [Dichotomocladium elegans]|nr:major facilitator superfamily domain-containing protein [Dichotomocladium elegans]